MRKAYISGPITGLPYEEVVAKFQEAEEHLINEGWEPVNPTKNGLPIESSWAQHMSRDIEMMMDCEAIFLLPGWARSKGARIEKYIAQEMGIKVFKLTEIQEAVTKLTHFKVADKVTETFDGVINEAEIVHIDESGRVALRNEKGEHWGSNLAWLTHCNQQ